MAEGKNDMETLIDLIVESGDRESFLYAKIRNMVKILSRKNRITLNIPFIKKHNDDFSGDIYVGLHGIISSLDKTKSKGEIVSFISYGYRILYRSCMLYGYESCSTFPRSYREKSMSDKKDVHKLFRTILMEGQIDSSKFFSYNFGEDGSFNELLRNEIDLMMADCLNIDEQIAINAKYFQPKKVKKKEIKSIFGKKLKTSNLEKSALSKLRKKMDESNCGTIGDRI